jgi:hypothetical protein
VLEDILIFGTGVFSGIFFTLFWMNIRGRWKKSQSLRQSSAKVRKENEDRAKKASADAKLARDNAFRTVLETFMFVAAVMLLAWLVYILFT